MITSTLIYTVAAFSIGVFVGMILELITDNSLIKRLEEENDHLRIKLADAQNNPKIDRIEILDRTSIEAEDLFKPF